MFRWLKSKENWNVYMVKENLNVFIWLKKIGMFRQFKNLECLDGGVKSGKENQGLF